MTPPEYLEWAIPAVSFVAGLVAKGIIENFLSLNTNKALENLKAEIRKKETAEQSVSEMISSVSFNDNK